MLVVSGHLADRPDTKSGRGRRGQGAMVGSAPRNTLGRSTGWEPIWSGRALHNLGSPAPSGQLSRPLPGWVMLPCVQGFPKRVRMVCGVRSCPALLTVVLVKIPRRCTLQWFPRCDSRGCFIMDTDRDSTVLLPGQVWGCCEQKSHQHSSAHLRVDVHFPGLYIHIFDRSGH